jgi:AcrR family transcriptional regulator
MQAASELLLEHGLSSISMDAIAERARTSKATIYRWWPNKELLAADALFTAWQQATPVDSHDTGSLAGDLLALVGPWARRLATGADGRVIAALLARASHDPAFAEEYRARFVQPRRDPARVIFARAIDRGEIPADADIEIALDVLFSPFYHRLLHGHAPVTDRFARVVVDYVVAGASRPAGRVA